ncbi:MAG: ABC-F family ATP-binding cassette domain-containing protein [Alkalinema sp. RU_4_3]|nr:ABC-F family ATP-binding cassette domain-containing protein [Alkalinema sp. RU_4_3]
MAILTVRSLKKDFGIKAVLKDASFSVELGDRIGLIGTNGSGKSTLLKMLAGLEPMDAGELERNNGLRMIYLSQQPDLDDSRTIMEQILFDCGETPDSATAWEVEAQAQVMLGKLGIQDVNAPVAGLSGGYRKRIAIATALISEPDVLLMDEPTNHLDADSVEWLQSHLARYRGALMLVTHDRYFLDQVTNRILEIDQAELFPYSGNYSYYLEKKAEQEDSNQSSQRKFAGVLRRELEWLKKGPKARSTKQKARIGRIEDMREKEFRTGQGKVEISTVGRRIGKKVVALEGVTKAWGDRTVVNDFTYEFTPEDRIGIIGVNGAGKSTLMNIITGRLAPDSGKVDIGTTIEFGYFDQHSDDLKGTENMRVIDYLKTVAELVKTADGSVITASQMLERFLFNPNQQYAPIEKLSGGEKRRLFLLRVLLQAPNVLILDEPTNDLDVQTLSVLEEYLEDFKGAVFVVSHDRYFLDRTVDTIFALEEGGEIGRYPGNYSVYLEHRKAKNAAKLQAAKQQSKSSGAAVAPAAAVAEVVAPEKKARKVSFKEKREFEQLEVDIPKWEAEKAKVETQIYHNPPSGHSELQKLTDRLTELDRLIEQGTERWMVLSELM